VLVVEDEGLIAQDISNRLETLGHTVVAAVGTAEEAIEHAANADIVLMDIHLDGSRDGVEAATEIRERFRVPVVFLTAHADRPTLERAKLAAPFGYMVKPLTHASLNSSIEIAVHKHQLERVVEEREAWLRTTLNAATDAIIVAGVDGRVQMLNLAAARLTGWSEPEARDQSVLHLVRLIDGKSGETMEDPMPVALLRDAAIPLDRDTLLVARNGRQLAVEGSVAPVKAAHSTLGLVLTLRDVSARRWEERQFRQAQKMEAVGRLAAGVSVEYANLLTIIRTQAEQLLHQFGEYPPVRRAVDEIQQAASAAGQITRRLENFSARQVSRQEVLSLNGVLRRMSKLIGSVLGDRIRLTVRPHPATGHVKVDLAQIEQMIMNLVLHSFGRMPEGGQLAIETANIEAPSQGRMSSYVLLTLAHSGRETEIEKLFEPVSTGEDGVALSIAHNIVTEHGGYISAHTTAEGGSRFEVLLPRSSEPALLPRPAESREAPSILLVDDRERVRSQLHNYFEANGYNLLEACDPEEALALGQVHEGGLDLVIVEDCHADAITGALQGSNPSLKILRIVEGPEGSPEQIRRPFTQTALLDRVAILLAAKPKIESASAG